MVRNTTKATEARKSTYFKGGLIVLINIRISTIHAILLVLGRENKIYVG